ncbi:MAG: 50S ribosomal protein L9 [Deltaproteobacteria bacterium]|nr:50S ribosomal protein L9 [Deltaproteobacteria bacterium]
MRVILTDDVVGVGDIGDTVTVKPGFGRNYLIPRGLALEFNARKAKSIAHKKAQIEAKKKKLKADAEGRAASLSSIAVELGLRVGEGGRVYGSVGSRDIARELASKGFEVDRRRVLLAEPIKRVGEYKVAVKLHAEVQSVVTVNVVPLAVSSKDEDEAVEDVKARLDASARKQSDAQGGDTSAE